MKTKQNKIKQGKIINGLKFYSVKDVFGDKMKSKEFRAGYEQELARLHLVRQIREMRESKKMTQEKLAKKVSMPQSVIARIESGKHSFSLATLSRIAKVFNKQVKLV